jgi:predicted permease
MIRNYFVTALRTLLRNRTYALLNVAGLSVGITACILIFLLLRFELSYDNFHARPDRIYRVTTEFNGPEGKGYTPGVPEPAPEALRTDFPQLEVVAPIYTVYNGQMTTYQGGKPDKKFKEDLGIILADGNFLKVFNYPLLSGNPDQALGSPNTVALTRETAQRYFGDWRRAVGQTLRFNYDTTAFLRVTAVLADMPVNTDFPIKALVSYKTRRTGSDWGSLNSNMQCYVVLPPGMSQAQFEGLMPGFSKKYREPRDVGRVTQVLQPLADFHFDERYGSYSGRTVSRGVVRAIAIVGIFLLVTACINFINLATAQAVKRAKEVGVRKVLGGDRNQLIGQFIGETTLITLVAVVLSTVAALCLLPVLNAFMDVQIPLQPLTDWQLFGFLLLLLVVMSLLSGLYPAFVLSGFRPVEALKSRITTTSVAGLSLRRSLVVVQFIISQVLVIGTLVAVSQMQYFKNAPLGFSKDAIITVPLPEDPRKAAKLGSLYRQLADLRDVESVSLSFTPPSADANWNASWRFSDQAERAPYPVNMKPADTAYVRTYGLQLVAGRMYQAADTARELVVNETFVKKAGLKNAEAALGKLVVLGRGGTPKPIVGVVKDFHLYSLRQGLDPCVLLTHQPLFSMAGLKVRSQNLPGTVEAIKGVWSATFPDFVFEHEFLDQTIARFYQSEDRLTKLFQVLAGVAIFIGCLGLYGLVSFMAERKVKEVGVRKVLGASTGNIVFLFSKEFLQLIAVAFVIAAPLSYFLMDKWLQDYENRIPLGAGVFLLAAGVTVLIAFLTVGYRSVRAATANPVKALRSE